MDRNLTFPVVPAPTKIADGKGSPLILDAEVSVTANSPAAHDAAEYLARALAEAGIAATALTPESAAVGIQIHLRLTSADFELNEDGLPGIEAESYELSITDTGAQISASAPAGLQHGATTVAQLLTQAEDAWQLPATEITDAPRYAWRGLSLDIARSFSPLEEIKEIIDVLVDLKYNVLHLHLCDDQGWRLQIRSHPELTKISGNTAVEGGRTGFLTQADYTELIDYAAARHILVVPEIDVPGHTHALLHALPLADVGRKAPEPHTGIEAGFSELRLDDPTAVATLTALLPAVRQLTPGPWIHIGGDEPLVIPGARSATPVARAETAGRDSGRTAIGWNEFVRG